MNRNERANDMYSRLNVLVEEIKTLNVKKITDEDVVRKIISILPRPEYQIIATLLLQEDLERMTQADVLRRTTAHELYELGGVLAQPLHQERTLLSRLSMSQEKEGWPRKTQVMMKTMKMSPPSSRPP